MQRERYAFIGDALSVRWQRFCTLGSIIEFCGSQVYVPHREPDVWLHSLLIGCCGLSAFHVEALQFRADIHRTSLHVLKPANKNMTKEEINIRPRFKRLKRLFHRRQDDDLPPSQEPNLPVGRSTADDVSKNERLPESVALAQKILDKAVDNLKKKLPPDIELRSKLVIKGSADLKSLSQNVTAELLKMITKEEIKESKEIVNFVLSWAQKILPFVQQGLSIANVQHTLHEFGTDYLRI